jgi:hypothetical protein
MYIRDPSKILFKVTTYTKSELADPETRQEVFSDVHYDERLQPKPEFLEHLR